jgi:hypothetical protein
MSFASSINGSLLLVLLLAACPVVADTQPVRFLDMTADVPADWVTSEPSSNMRVLQASVPAADGEGAELVVYYFGPGQGGTLEDNVARWASQFSSAEGAAVEPVITQLEGTLPATLVELTGSYARGVGIGPTGDALPERTLLAGVVETPSGNLYPQLHGPADLVAEHRAAFVTLIESIRADAAP